MSTIRPTSSHVVNPAVVELRHGHFAEILFSDTGDRRCNVAAADQAAESLSGKPTAAHGSEWRCVKSGQWVTGMSSEVERRVGANKRKAMKTTKHHFRKHCTRHFEHFNIHEISR